MDITFKQVDYFYQAGTPMESRALFNISLKIPHQSYTAIIGHTGSGKSTILQHLNALIQPTNGVVTLGEQEITATSKQKNLKPLRKKVGIVFQFPEAQLFEETVEKDIAFGPKNFGVSEEEANQLASEMLGLVGLPQEILQRSPFDLSGGQMRRVAIAGVLAMQPEVLVLDEPTAGLDPRGRMEMMELFSKLHKEKGLTIVLVTHQMNDVADYANHVVVVENGSIVKTGTPKEIFSDQQWIKDKHLELPTAAQFAQQLVQKGWSISSLPLTLEELITYIQEDRGESKHV